jgi:cellulose biosynthesis protein BcsQ
MMLNLIRREYDYIFIDSSPKRDKLAECLLCNTDAILLPIDIGYKSLKHAINLAQEVIPAIQTMRDRANGFTVGPWNLGLLFSNCPNNIGVGIESSIAKVIATQKFTGKQVNTKLTTYAQTKQAEFQGRPVVCWQSSYITKLFYNLTNEVFLGHNYTNN